MPTGKTITVELLEDSNTYATVLATWLIDRYGLAVVEWDPDTIRMEVATVAPNIPAGNLDKLNAAMLVLANNQFYVSLESFVHCCNAFYGHGVDFNQFDLADVNEMCWGITEAALLEPPPGDIDAGEVFSQEIRYYMGLVAARLGYTRLPRPLDRFAVATDNFAHTMSNYSDVDADMFAAYWSRQRDQVSDVEQEVQRRLNELLSQIDRLPLVHRDPESWRRYFGTTARRLGR